MKITETKAKHCRIKKKLFTWVHLKVHPNCWHDIQGNFLGLHWPFSGVFEAFLVPGCFLLKHYLLDDRNAGQIQLMRHYLLDVHPRPFWTQEFLPVYALTQTLFPINSRIFFNQLSFFALLVINTCLVHRKHFTEKKICCYNCLDLSNLQSFSKR